MALLTNISSSEARLHASLGLRSTQVRILPIRQHSLEAHEDGHRAFNSGVAGSRPAGGTRWVSHLDGQVGKCICLDGVMEAYLFYMQMAVVRFHFEVQKGKFQHLVM